MLLRLLSRDSIPTPVSDDNSLSSRTQVVSNNVGEEMMAIDAESSPKVSSFKGGAPASTCSTRLETIDGMEVNGMSQGDIEMQ